MITLRNFQHFLKKFFLLLLAIFISFSQSVSAVEFSDVKMGNPYFLAINFLNEKGIINGYENGKFMPYTKASKAEALKMLTFASGALCNEEIENMEDLSENPFKDVSLDIWYAKIIQAAKDKNIINGDGSGNFYPDKRANLAESLKMYLESFKNTIYPIEEIYDKLLFNDTENTAWYTKYFAFASLHDMLDIDLKNNVYPDQEISRGYLAEIIYKHIKYNEGYSFGKATFYGSAVQGHKTASGEIFDKDAFTAAHKTLPFGTIVEVTNLANGKSVNARITDRGPYGAGRVLDLSSGAFAQIASISSGVIDVQYKIVE